MCGRFGGIDGEDLLGEAGDPPPKAAHCLLHYLAAVPVQVLLWIDGISPPSVIIFFSTA